MFAKLGSQNTGADVLYGSPLSPLRCSAISRPWRQLALNLCDPRNSVIQAHTPTILPFSRRPLPQSKDPLPVVAARRTFEENPQEICQGHGTCPPKCESRRAGVTSLPPTLARTLEFGQQTMSTLEAADASGQKREAVAKGCRVIWTD